MRRDLARDGQALGPRGAYHVKAARRGDVLDVKLAARQAAQRDVAGDLQLFAFRRPAEQAEARGGNTFVDLAFAHQILVLAVAHDHAAELAGVVHDAAHHARALHAMAVVGERHGAVSDHVAHLGQRFTLQALRAGAGHVHAALAHLCGDGLHILHGHRVVHNRVRVRHGAHGREAAVCRRARAGSDVFLLLEARLAQMHMHIHQTRKQNIFM